MKIPKGPLRLLPKCPLKQMIQPYPGATQPMIGCSGTKESRTFSSWIPSLQPRKVANHHKAIPAVNYLSLIKDSYVVPTKKKFEVLLAIKQFAKEIGAPDSFVADMSGEQMSSEVKKFCNDIGTTLRALEEGTPWSNKAELYIGLIKEAVRIDMCESNSPLCFWDYCVERRARINNLRAKNAFKLHGSTPHIVTTGDEGDISNLCQYGWYEWCYFRDQTTAFPNNKEVLGRVLGHARGAGNEMAQWILKAIGKVVPRRPLSPLKVDEIHSPVEIKKREVFDELIQRRWGTPMTPPNTQ